MIFISPVSSCDRPAYAFLNSQINATLVYLHRYKVVAFTCYMLSLQDVMNAFEEHCNLKKNETVERYKFFTRIQEEGESIKKFVTDLKLLAATCNFGTLHDSLLRDRIICGIRNSALRKVLLKKWLTLILTNYVCVRVA